MWSVIALSLLPVTVVQQARTLSVGGVCWRASVPLNSLAREVI